MSSQVLHLDFIKLSREAGPEQRSQIEAAAAGLGAIEGVAGIGVIEADDESDFDVAVWFLLREFTVLEPFGTDPRYSQFLQGTVATMLSSFAGADVRLEDDFNGRGGPAACLALMGPEEAYDFEVREALEAWADGNGGDAGGIGVAVGERQQYRGAAIVFGLASRPKKPDTPPFRATLIRGEAKLLL